MLTMVQNTHFGISAMHACLFHTEPAAAETGVSFRLGSNRRLRRLSSAATVRDMASRSSETEAMPLLDCGWHRRS